MFGFDETKMSEAFEYTYNDAVFKIQIEENYFKKTCKVVDIVSCGKRIEWPITVKVNYDTKNFNSENANSEKINSENSNTENVVTEIAISSDKEFPQVEEIFIHKDINVFNFNRTSFPNLKAFEVDEENGYYSVLPYNKKIIFNKEKSRMITSAMNVSDDINIRRVIVPESVYQVCSFALSDTDFTDIVFEGDIKKMYFAKPAFIGSEFMKNAGDYFIYDNVLVTLLNNLESFRIPKNVDYIARDAFLYNGVKELIIDHKVEVSDDAFLDLFYEIKEPVLRYEFKDELCEKGSEYFVNRIYIQGEAEDFEFSRFASVRDKVEIKVSPDAVHYKVVDGMVLSEDGTKLLFAEKRDSDNKKYVIPDSVEVICDKAFYKSDCEEVIFGENVTIVGISAFEECARLHTVVLNKKLKDINSGAFKRTAINNIEFHKGLKTIGKAAFAFTNIEEIELPPRLVEVREYAFNTVKVVNTERGLKADILRSLVYDGKPALGENIEDDLITINVKIPNDGPEKCTVKTYKMYKLMSRAAISALINEWNRGDMSADGLDRVFKGLDSPAKERYALYMYEFEKNTNKNINKNINENAAWNKYLRKYITNIMTKKIKENDYPGFIKLLDHPVITEKHLYQLIDILNDMNRMEAAAYILAKLHGM